MNIGRCRTILHTPIIAHCCIFKSNRTQRKVWISPDLHNEFARSLPIFRLGINGPSPIFRGPAERVYPQTVPCSFVSRLRYKQFPKLFVPPDHYSPFYFLAREKMVPLTITRLLVFRLVKKWSPGPFF